jgi:hypothetical protein
MSLDDIEEFGAYALRRIAAARAGGKTRRQDPEAPEGSTRATLAADDRVECSPEPP